MQITLTKDSYILFDVNQCTPEQVLQYLINNSRTDLIAKGNKAARNIGMFLLLYSGKLEDAAAKLKSGVKDEE